MQARVARALGTVGGWKVGARSADAAPHFAPLARAGLYASPAAFSAAHFPMRGIEVEVGFRLGADLPPRTRPYDGTEVARAVDAALVLIEVVESRLADVRAAGPLWALADNQSHGAFVLGEARAEWQRLELHAPAVRLVFGGRVVVDGSCDHPAGDAFSLLVALANATGGHCGGLRAGQVVATGTLTGLEQAPVATTVHASVRGLGDVRLRFD